MHDEVATAAEQAILATGIPHLEIFQATVHEGDICVSCLCPIGSDHSYAEGTKYLAPVEPRR